MNFQEVVNVLAEGKTKSSVILKNGMQIDLRVVKKESFGAALHYFTGSKEHNIKIRDIAKKRGLKVNEYGLFKEEKMLAGESEEEIYDYLGYQFIPPEMRVGKNEFELAKTGKKLPKLLTKNDLSYDFQIHSEIGKGTFSVKALLQISKKHQKKFVIADSYIDSESFKNKLIEQIAETKKHSDKLIQGLEVKASKDGEIIIDESLLKDIKILMVSPESLARLDNETQTKRLLNIIENKNVKILNHPTGRLIQRRDEMQYDHKTVFKACAENDVAIQINGQPRRLDLQDKYIQLAKSFGVKFVLASEAKTEAELDYLEFSLGIARRGQLTKNDLLVI